MPLILLRRHLDQLDLSPKVKEGETNNDLYVLTTEPNAEVGAIHPKAMPVILTRLTPG
jgi:putative SOS response-associated peptidase YedK